MRVLGTAAFALLLAGCGGLPAVMQAPSDPTSAPPELELAPDGLNVRGTDGLVISYGRAMPGVVEAVRRVIGSPPSDPETNSECGAGPVTAVSFPEGLTLNFQNGAFAGWVANTPAAGETASGLSVGDGRDALGGAATAQTSLGEEAESGGVFVLLDDAGSVDLMWSGVTCFFR